MIDFNKPIQTRDGRPVRVLCTDNKAPFSVIALVDECVPHMYLANGRFASTQETALDLINGPEQTIHYVVIDGDDGYVYTCSFVPETNSNVIKYVMQQNKIISVELVGQQS